MRPAVSVHNRLVHAVLGHATLMGHNVSSKSVRYIIQLRFRFGFCTPHHAHAKSTTRNAHNRSHHIVLWAGVCTLTIQVAVTAAVMAVAATGGSASMAPDGIVSAFARACASISRVSLCSVFSS